MSNGLKKIWLKRIAVVLICLFATVLGLKIIGALIFTPRINPNPQDPLTIRGAFPFDKGYDLVFNQGARTTTPWVNVICGGFGVIAGWDGFSCNSDEEILRPQKIGCCSYEVTFFRDQYLPGIAGWKHSGFGFGSFSSGTPRVLVGALPKKSKMMKCWVDPKLNRPGHNPLLCNPPDEFRPDPGDESRLDIYDKSTRYAELNFYLASELLSTTQGK